MNRRGKTLCAGLLAMACFGHTVLANEVGDSRLRSVAYSASEVYRLHAYVGYQIELQFDPAETFSGLSAGDMEALAFSAQSNHLFIKPKATGVHTNLTVLTSERIYHFDYSVSASAPDPDHEDVLYALSFIYAPVVAPPIVAVPPPVEAARARNEDYWFCGDRLLQPQRAWDDGVQTHLQFASRSELPAIFVQNDDSSESLLNFHVVGSEVVLQRLARRIVLRRGRLTGCVVNRGYAGSGEWLPSGTLTPGLSRESRSDNAPVR